MEFPQKSKSQAPYLWDLPVREIEIDTEAQNPEVELNFISEAPEQTNDLPQEHMHFLKSHGLYEDYIIRNQRQPDDIAQFINLKRKHELNAALYHNPLDEFPDIEGHSHALNHYNEQQKYQDIKTVIRWKTGLEMPC